MASFLGGGERGGATAIELTNLALQFKTEKVISLTSK